MSVTPIYPLGVLGKVANDSTSVSWQPMILANNSWCRWTQLRRISILGYEFSKCRCHDDIYFTIGIDGNDAQKFRKHGTNLFGDIKLLWTKSAGLFIPILSHYMWISSVRSFFLNSKTHTVPASHHHCNHFHLASKKF